MSNSNFIEIWYEDEHCTHNWFATRSVTSWKDDSPSIMNCWQLEGSSIHVYDKHDIAALRKLLDAIEKELTDETV